MRVDHVLERVGGVADAGALVRLTSRARVRRAVRRGRITRAARGRYVLPAVDDGRRAASADGRAANPFESVLRARALEAGLDVEPQVRIGAVRPDLVDQARRLVLEADSHAFHGSRGALLRDCERYNALVVAGWTVLRFGWEHVMLRPDYVLGILRSVASEPVGRAVPPPSYVVPA